MFIFNWCSPSTRDAKLSVFFVSLQHYKLTNICHNMKSESSGDRWLQSRKCYLINSKNKQTSSTTGWRWSSCHWITLKKKFCAIHFFQVEVLVMPSTTETVFNDATTKARLTWKKHRQKSKHSWWMSGSWITNADEMQRRRASLISIEF